LNPGPLAPQAITPSSLFEIAKSRCVPAKLDPEWNNERVWRIASPRNHNETPSKSITYLSR
jgi:hypothetical protein